VIAARLSGPREDLVDKLGPLLGRENVSTMLTNLEATVRTEVQSTARPYVLAALALGGLGALVGTVALVRARRR
jgi:hypothetical protein